MDKGWVSIHRKLLDNWMWKEKRTFSKAEAWIDVLLNVNHSEQKVLIKNTLFIVKRGESIKSLDTWGSRWNWNKSKVRRFLNLLRNENMIELKNEQKTTRLTVCKYDSYQGLRNANETQMKHKRNANETQTTPNNNDNNINNENNVNNDVLENDTSVFYDIGILKKHYLTKDKVINAVISNKKNNVKDKSDLLSKFELFNQDLLEQGKLKMNWKDYSSYFRNCLKVNKFKETPKEMTLKDKEKHLYGKIIF